MSIITVTDLVRWCEGAEAGYGDPAAVCGLMFVRYREHVDQAIDGVFDGDDGVICAEFFREELLIDLLGTPCPLKINTKEVRYGEVGGGTTLLEFGIEEITRGVWALMPSLNLPGILHAFVVVYDVPSPAPWERLILMPGEF